MLCWKPGDIKKKTCRGSKTLGRVWLGTVLIVILVCVVAAMMTWKFQPIHSHHVLWNRTGMAPGFCCPIDVVCPLQRDLSYRPISSVQTIQDLHKCLLRRVNHTGSDVRVSTGIPFLTQNVPSSGCTFILVELAESFACRWARQDHIKCLELQSILHTIQWRIGHLKET